MDLIEGLDPEEARAIVDPALNLMMEAVQRHGGHVAQPTGDGIFALFGAPVAHEDHARRALLAALRMQAELKRYSNRIRAEGRLPIQARVGVNTGEAVMRSITTGEDRTEYAKLISTEYAKLITPSCTSTRWVASRPARCSTRCSAWVHQRQLIR
jgi:class 3 adenylate cyclase